MDGTRNGKMGRPRWGQDGVELGPNAFVTQRGMRENQP